MEADPKPAPPVYAPEVAAEAILRCAEQPLRDVFAGASAVAISASGAHAKRVTDKLMERTMFRGQQHVDRGRTREEDNLFAPLDHDGGERGRYDGPVLEHSLAPALAGRGRISALSLMAAGIALYAGSRLLRGDQHAGTGAAGDDVAAGLASADYGRAEYASAEAQLAVADSAEGAQHTPGSGQ